MSSKLSRKRRFGFTLIEILVTTVVIAVLAAVVLPTVAKQTSAADPARVLSDLANIKMGIEVFANNMRPDFPSDLEDIVNAPTQSTATVVSGVYDDLSLSGVRYANTANWKGPYVAQALPEGFTTASGLTPWRAGANGFYNNAILRCDITAVAACTPVTSGTGAYVTLLLEGLSSNEATNIDNLLDGGIGSTSGTFRYITSGTSQAAYYFAVPYTQ